NVVNALTAAGEGGLFTVALTGSSGGKVAAAADICIRVPTEDTPRVQEACFHLGHTICEIVEREMSPEANPAVMLSSSLLRPRRSPHLLPWPAATALTETVGLWTGGGG